MQEKDITQKMLEQFNDVFSNGNIEKINLMSYLSEKKWLGMKKCGLLLPFLPEKFGGRKNSQFEIGKGPTMDPKTNKAKANSQDDAVLSSTYWAERDEITQWSFENGYNPAFIISLIKVLTDDGNKELSGSKYNFLNDQSIVKLKDAQNGDSGSSSGSKPEEKKEEKKADNPDSANKDAEKDPVDDTSWKEYGASYYNYTINITNIQQGLEALDRKLSENNDSKEWNLEQAKKLGLKDEQFERINHWYKKSGGQGSTHAVFANQELKKVKVHTYNGKGPEDTDALGVISIKGKVDRSCLMNNHSLVPLQM